MNKKYKSSIKKFVRHPLSLAIALSLTGDLAHATVMNVSGACTMVNAIKNANADADTDGKDGCPAGKGPDIINLAAGKIYALTTANNTTDGANGLPSITSNITINGNKATLQRSLISGTPRFRLLHIGANGKLTINKLTIKNGQTSYIDPIYYSYAFAGGGIYNRGRLQLTDSRVMENTTLRKGGYAGPESGGGGIFNARSGKLTLKKSNVSGNHAYTGGGISNQGDLNVIGSIISNNSTKSRGFYNDYWQGGSGGGIAHDSGGLLVRNCVVQNSIISNNVSYSRGGGISNASGNLVVNKSVLLNNTATRGGGISNNKGTMTLANSIINKNIARPHYVGVLGYIYTSGDEGGGIHNADQSSAHITNSSIINNKAMSLNDSLATADTIQAGGGIFNASAMLLSNSTVWNNFLEEEVYSKGGGGLFNKGDLTITHSTIAHNNANSDLGGGINNTSNLHLKNSLIANSLSGGDCRSSSSVTLSGANLIEDGSCGVTLSGDPKLGGIVNNGGLTVTQTLQPGSPAIDAVFYYFCLKSDQRGVSRPLPEEGKCDIGAYEHIPDTPASVTTIVGFFDTNVASGGIVGTGTSAQAIIRRDGFRNQLLTAGNYNERNLITQACDQLARTVKRIDPDDSPKVGDYVTGNAADTLAAEVIALRSDWDCPE